MMPDLSALIQQCAPGVGPVTMAAIVRTESGGVPWRIGDNTTGSSYTLPTKEAAVARATELTNAGHDLDMGLGQINSRNLKGLGLTIEQVFEPCTNLGAAARILTWGYQRAVKVHGPGQEALLAAISTYNTGSLTAGFSNGYVRTVTSNSGLRVELNVPSLTQGEIVRGRRGSVRVGAGGALSPYEAPLEAFSAQRLGKRQSYRSIYEASMDVPGFGPQQ
ncbi:lytic transglycosylase domain-containing protein [Burkholderia vietnamiensis]|uniref:lytic transglycosylase domain-containing protein n=1 Tax=Burkholderia vietnamiensis TaxID=60552 RepID=UPI001592E797|nr:lytic transglycosylase domain-containing protein [Burkholderia vietnamiensis]MCA8270400.1 lytic transglycosylase domain-containing protein [Burkholderia vietnamiensis]